MTMAQFSAALGVLGWNALGKDLKGVGIIKAQCS